MLQQQIELQPPDELLAFVERQIRHARTYGGVERRRERRHLMAAPVMAQPVDREFNPIGAPFAMATRDISRNGIGLVHTHTVDHQWLALQMCLAGELVNVVVEVVWCKPLGPFEYLGGRFVAKLDSFPRRNDDATESDAKKDPPAKSPSMPTPRPSRPEWKPRVEGNSPKAPIPFHVSGPEKGQPTVRRADAHREFSDRSL